ncbi:MAG: serine/threonine-protein kinase, partial [Planctomycetota bacterium]
MLKIAAYSKIATEMNLIPADQINDVVGRYRAAGANQPFERWAVANQVFSQVQADRLVVAFCNSNFRCTQCDEVNAGAALAGDLDVVCPSCGNKQFKRVKGGSAVSGAHIAQPPPPPVNDSVFTATADEDAGFTAAAPDAQQQTLFSLTGGGGASMTADAGSGSGPMQTSGGIGRTAAETRAEPTAADFDRGLQAGQRIGNWEVIKLAGKGGMGAVYKAQNPDLEQFAAIKVLNANYLENSTQVLRFKEEARACARLEHPNIIQVKDFGEVCGRAYLVLQWVDGGSLNDRIKDGGPMPAREMLEVGVQCCRGFAEAHRAGIVHRDIKPDNIMIASQGGRVKIADFGLAKSMDPQKEGLTATGYFLGTPAYISPEQINNTNITPAADIYSLGATFYHMLLGKVPFKAGSIATVLHKHIAEDFPSLRDEGRTDIPESLDNLIQHMCAKRAEDRPQSMDEIGDMLEAILVETTGGMTAVAKLQGTRFLMPTASKIEKLSPAQRKKLASTMNTHAGGLMGDTVERSSERRAPADLPAKKGGAGALILVLLLLLVGGGGAAYWFVVKPMLEEQAGANTSNAANTGPMAGVNNSNNTGT